MRSRKSPSISIASFLVGAFVLPMSSFAQTSRPPLLVEGGAHGGGGNLCIGGPNALNVGELSDTSFQKIGFPEKSGLRVDGPLAKEFLRVSGALGFDFLRWEDPQGQFLSNPRVASDLRQRIREIIDRARSRWGNNKSLLLERMASFVGYHPFLGFDDSIQGSISTGALSKKLCPENQIQAAIRFTKGMIFLSLPIFNRMSLNQQAALFIHEGLRWVQQNHTGFDLTDDLVESITRAVVLADFSDPSAKTYLDQFVQSNNPIFQKRLKNFERLSATLPYFDQFYRDVVMLGPIATLHSYIPVLRDQYPWTIERWYEYEWKGDYRRRLVSLLSFLGIFYVEDETPLAYLKARLAIEQSWQSEAGRDAWSAKKLAAHSWASRALHRLFQEGVFEVDGRLSDQMGFLFVNGQYIPTNEPGRNILNADSKLVVNISNGDTTLQAQSCACASTPDQMVVLTQHLLTLSPTSTWAETFDPIQTPDGSACFLIWGDQRSDDDWSGMKRIEPDHAVSNVRVPGVGDAVSGFSVRNRSADQELGFIRIQPASAINQLGLYRCDARYFPK